jgi:hypothetical protein
MTRLTSTLQRLVNAWMLHRACRGASDQEHELVHETDGPRWRQRCIWCGATTPGVLGPTTSLPMACAWPRR